MSSEQKYTGMAKLFAIEERQRKEKSAEKPISAATAPEIIAPAEAIAPPATSSAPVNPSAPANLSAPEISPPQPLQIAAAEEIAAPEIFAHPEQHTRIPNEMFEKILPTLRTSEQSVLLRLYRLSWGFQKDTCHVSMGKLAKYCNLSPRQVTTCVQALEERRLIRRLNVDLDNKNQNERGVTYQMLLPSVARAKSSALAKFAPPATISAPATTADNKRKDFKGNSKKGINRLAPEEIQSFTAAVADLLRQGSTIEEVEPRFAPTMHPVDWATVRSTALAQAQASFKV
jgi:DNA-binding Lrp family transcriptional regulator